MSRRSTSLFLVGVFALAACSSSSTAEPSSGGGGAGGAGTGGVSTGGSAGVSTGGGGSGGGSGGSNLVDRCDATCNTLVAVGCSNGLTKAGCMVTCKALTSSPKCDPTGKAYFDCADGKKATCNGAGDPVIVDCAIANLNALNCAVGENPNPAIVGPCVSYCDAVTAKSCANNLPKAECNTNCQWAGATGIGCDDEWKNFVTCANGKPITCVVGYALSIGCGAEFKVYTNCINAASAG